MERRWHIHVRLASYYGYCQENWGNLKLCPAVSLELEEQFSTVFRHLGHTNQRCSPPPSSALCPWPLAQCDWAWSLGLLHSRAMQGLQPRHCWAARKKLTTHPGRATQKTEVIIKKIDLDSDGFLTKSELSSWIQLSFKHYAVQEAKR